ncbi:MAG: hypothetical protein PHW27_00055 [Melioribacteraceae bacterium]|nr:hypothetical protein [Melioribacteraceae bacterium]MDD3556945.1 hypothetical protein [Melioribacteraceae bacterium]
MINLFAVGTKLEDVKLLKEYSSPIVEQLADSDYRINFIGYFNSTEKLLEYFKVKTEIETSSIIINTSGGTEDLINIIVSESNSPVLILADNKRNSFASSLEAYAYLKGKHPVKIGYAETNDEKIDSAKTFCDVVTAIERINSSRFGIIGKPSDWLLTSRDINSFGEFNTSLIKIDINNLVKEVEKTPIDDAALIIKNWKSSYKNIFVDDVSLIESAKVYLALRNIASTFELDSLSIRCFDLLKYNYTACMGISLCNDNGITSGCEGDIPATFTMIIAQQISGRPVWMANPSSINKAKNEIVFAHCTVPVSLLENQKEAELTTHMESGKSTALRGPLKKSPVTILRIGSKFDKIIAAKGVIVDSDMQDVNLCRTQAVIKIEADLEKWIENALGNHQVICYGDIIPALNYFCEFTGVELVKI